MCDSKQWSERDSLDTLEHMLSGRIISTLAYDRPDPTCTTDTGLNCVEKLDPVHAGSIRTPVMYSLWMLHVLLVICSYYFCVQILLYNKKDNATMEEKSQNLLSKNVC